METIHTNETETETPSQYELARAWESFILAARAILGFRVFRVVVAALPELEATIAKVAKRAAKHGLPTPTLEVIGEPEDVRRRGERGSFILTVVRVRLNAPVIKVGDSSFVAACHHTEAGSLVMAAPAFHGADLSEYRTLDGKRCDHCGTKRSRQHSYVIDRAGERVVVGGTCLRDYLGIDLAVELAWKGYGAIWSALLDAAKDCESEMSSGGGRWGNEDTVDFLARAIAAIELCGGYRKASNDDGGTRMTVAATRSPSARMMEDDDFRALVAKGRARGTLAAAAFLRGWAMVSLGESDFDHNLRVAATCNGVVGRGEGILCYLYEAYRRARGIEVAKRAPVAAPRLVGTVGERLTVAATVVRLREMDSAFGLRTMVAFRADDGGDLVWWKSGAFDGQVGGRGMLKATVKAHGDYQGVPQTTVARGVWTPA